MCIAAGLYTTFTAFDTLSGAWIGFQVLQGLGVGLTMQVTTLILQQDLEGSPLLPVGVSLGLFAQYLGATVSQVIAGSIFNTSLRGALGDTGLSQAQIRLLLQAGTGHVRETTQQYFPDLFVLVLDAYNYAITRVYVRFPLLLPLLLSILLWRAACRWAGVGTNKQRSLFR